jgi:hypothetical protein
MNKEGGNDMLKWTHTRPTVEGLYHIHHPTIQQQILDLWRDGEFVWDDPNDPDEGYEYLELPDDTLYAGPFHRPEM